MHYHTMVSIFGSKSYLEQKMLELSMIPGELLWLLLIADFSMTILNFVK